MALISAKQGTVTLPLFGGDFYNVPYLWLVDQLPPKVDRAGINFGSGTSTPLAPFGFTGFNETSWFSMGYDPDDSLQGSAFNHSRLWISKTRARATGQAGFTYAVSDVVPQYLSGTLDISTTEVAEQLFQVHVGGLNTDWTSTFTTIIAGENDYSVALFTSAASDFEAVEPVPGSYGVYAVKHYTDTSRPSEIYSAFKIPMEYVPLPSAIGWRPTNLDTMTGGCYEYASEKFRVFTCREYGDGDPLVVGYPRKLYSFELQAVTTNPTFDKETITLDDATDDTFFKLAYERVTGSGIITDGLLSMHPTLYGWFATIYVALEMGEEIYKFTKFLQFNLDFTKYREIIFDPQDAEAEFLLNYDYNEPGAAKHLSLSTDYAGNLILWGAIENPLGGAPINGIMNPDGGEHPDWIIPNIYDPPFANRVRAWSFTFEGHSFYVLRLGREGTFVYDVATQKWSEFATDDFELGGWRLSTGGNWAGPEIVAGDMMDGQIWSIDPEYQYDDESLITTTVTGFMSQRGLDYYPCNGVILTGSLSNVPADGFTLTLSISDDEGRTVTSMGDFTITPDNLRQPTWESLGQIGAPGRVFYITERGGMQRLDGLTTW